MVVVLSMVMDTVIRNFVYMDDDEWIGNQHVGIGRGRELVRGKKM